MIEIAQFIEMNKFLHFGNNFLLQQQHGKFSPYSTYWYRDSHYKEKEHHVSL